VKKQYKEPQMEVIEFDVEDVITTSVTTPGIDLPDDALDI